MKDARSLASVLSEMDAVLDSLIDISRQKQEIIVRGDSKALESILPLEEGLLNDLDLLEKERMERYQAAQSGTEAVNALRRTLRDKAALVSAANERNQALLRQGLEIARYILGLFVPDVGYGKQAAAGPLVFDHRA